MTTLCLELFTPLLALYHTHNWCFTSLQRRMVYATGSPNATAMTQKNQCTKYSNSSSGGGGAKGGTGGVAGPCACMLMCGMRALELGGARVTHAGEEGAYLYTTTKTARPRPEWLQTEAPASPFLSAGSGARYHASAYTTRDLTEF